MFKWKWKRPVLAMILLAFSLNAWAGIAEVRKQVESSMRVSGSIVVDTDGKVTELVMDQPDKIPVGVRNLVSNASATWRFEPVMTDGVARRARASMSLLVVAKKADEDNYSVELRSAYFGREADVQNTNDAGVDPETVRTKKLRPPQYPAGAAAVGATGMAFVVLKIARDGTVADAMVEKVNLQILAREDQMAQLRDQFAKSALRTCKSWTFEVPTQGPLAEHSYWLVRVPVAYQMMGAKHAGYGEWTAYVPGPVSPVPWVDLHDDAGASGVDAMADGRIYTVGLGLKLLTPLQAG